MRCSVNNVQHRPRLEYALPVWSLHKKNVYTSDRKGPVESNKDYKEGLVEGNKDCTWNKVAESQREDSSHEFAYDRREKEEGRHDYNNQVSK